jgi:hypothetical protein
MTIHAEFAGPFYVRPGLPGRFHVVLEEARRRPVFVALDMPSSQARLWTVWLNKAHQAGYNHGLQDAGLCKKRKKT